MTIPAVGTCPACLSRAGRGRAPAKGLAEGSLETDHHFGLIFCSVAGSYYAKLILRAAGPQRTIHPSSLFLAGLSWVIMLARPNELRRASRVDVIVRVCCWLCLPPPSCWDITPLLLWLPCHPALAEFVTCS